MVTMIFPAVCGNCREPISEWQIEAATTGVPFSVVPSRVSGPAPADLEGETTEVISICPDCGAKNRATIRVHKLTEA